MKSFPVHSYATTTAFGAVDPTRVVELPPPGPFRRRPRLATLATALAQRAIGEHRTGTIGDSLGAYFGTALGSLTETAAFLENMIEHDETAPKPRAFTYSVHNAAASHLAQTITARGENQTFVHGEISYAVALWAANRAFVRGGSPLIIGAADEFTPYVDRAHEAICPDAPTSGPSEGGAMLLALPGEGRDRETPAPIAWVQQVAFARPADPPRWLADQLVSTPVDRLWHGFPAQRGFSLSLGPRAESYLTFAGHHPAAGCVALAAAVAEAATTTTGIITASRLGDWSFVVVGSCPRSEQPA